VGLSCGMVFAQRACAPSAAHIASELSLIPRASVPWRKAPLWESSRDGQIAALELSAWHLVFGDVRPFLQDSLSNRLSELSTAGKVFCIITEGTSGGLGFELHEGGRQLRKWLEVEGVVDHNEGIPLKEEPDGIFTGEPDFEGERDFWKAVTVAERIVGVSWDSIHTLQADLHRAAP
jgi:hypothetical protein